MKTVEERLWPRVVVTGCCWYWTGAKIPTGYGSIRHQGKAKMVHRVAYEILVGPIPEGLELDHLCRVRNCVNPDHLDPVTHQVNVSRGRTGHSSGPRQTHCKRGHSFTEENTYMHNGKRHCRACKALRKQESKELAHV